MSNLAMIGTPGHYLALMECLNAFALEKADTELVLFFFEHDMHTRTFYHSSVNVGDWKKVYHVPVWSVKTSKRGAIKCVWNYKRFLWRLRDKMYKTVIANQYNVNYYKGIINTVRYERLISLDEGNAVFQVLSGRKRALETGNRFRVRDWLLGMKTDEPKHITFFSAYDIDVPECDVLVKCEFQWARGLLKDSVIRTGHVIFVGSPLAEDGIMAGVDYFNLLKEIRFLIPYSTIEYVPHRRENKVNTARYRDELGFEINSMNVPIEYYFCSMELLPEYTCGFNSAALWNLRRILAETSVRMVSFVYDLSLVLNKHQAEAIRVVYSNFSREGIEVIELPAKGGRISHEWETAYDTELNDERIFL